jgi:hypothetical protein
MPKLYDNPKKRLFGKTFFPKSGADADRIAAGQSGRAARPMIRLLKLDRVSSSREDRPSARGSYR